MPENRECAHLDTILLKTQTFAITNDLVNEEIDEGYICMSIERGNMVQAIIKKLGLRDDMRAFLENEPQSTRKMIDSQNLKVGKTLRGMFEYIHFFTTSQAEFKKRFPKLKEHLKPNGVLWVSWPKNRKLGTDLTLTKVIELGYDYGLVESKTISIDDTWSAIKFTHRKKGKEYKNSYGRLKP
jgi:hypothetical protein